MKKLSGLAILFVLAFSCSDDDNNTLTGRWELEKSICFECGVQNLPAGNGNILVFEKGNVFKRIENDAVVFKGSYHLGSDDGCGDHHARTLFTNETESTIPLVIKFESGKLTLSTPVCIIDGGMNTYRRIW